MQCPWLVALVILVAVAAARPPAADAAPRNPYSGFNLSGVNYGAQQWERAQREGRRVWPYYNTPAPRAQRAAVGGRGGWGLRRGRR